MTKYIKVILGACLILTSATVFADNTGLTSPKTGYFAGLGGSYHTLKFKQDYTAYGIGNVSDNVPVSVATGQVGGSAAPFCSHQSSFAPTFQAGYYNHSDHANHFWGIKYIYRYLDVTSSDSDIATPQSTILAPVGGTALRFTGNMITESAQTKINHEMHLLIYMDAPSKGQIFIWAQALHCLEQSLIFTKCCAWPT